LGEKTVKWMGLNEIREEYLSFFESKGHLRLKSFSLIPENDNSLLLINAGMAPLKPYFTGKEKPPRERVTTCQKCIRTPDIERVGKTARHGTFFEMLGNFSFGDYFKREAITWAWEFVTKRMEMPVDRLWVSIYQDDDEAYDIWVNEVGVAPDRVVRMGKEDNFWEIGTGPCGPCSEIYFDRGKDKGCGKESCGVGCDCDRFVEFWNLVFTQFDKDEQGNYHRLSKPNIDTGMGLERIAAIMQGVNSLFEVDTIKNIMESISSLAGIKYGEDPKKDVSLRVITDHVRSTTFMISDGVLPTNEGRGYVLRRLIRRAARHGKLLGLNEPFLYKITKVVVNESKGAYPELAENEEYITKVLKLEEERFEETINSGLVLLQNLIKEVKDNTLSGEDAFKLYDTYGFPIDLTVEICDEHGIKVDVDAFNQKMQEQRVRARESRKNLNDEGWSDDAYKALPKDKETIFLGYSQDECEAKILGIVKDGASSDTLHDGESGLVLLDQTVIYGESGGQVSDFGWLSNKGVLVEATHAKKLSDGRIINSVYVKEGTLKVNDTVKVTIDTAKRRATERNHSATHLLHKALREVLGNHVAQAGSYVDEGRLRFDFSHFQGLSPEEIKKVEDMVNGAVLASLEVKALQMPLDEAKKLGAMALFGEKYTDIVRVIKMGDFSIELCGGTHVKNTSQIGLFKIISEGGVAAGVRRIEAVTGEGVLRYIKERDDVIRESQIALKAQNFADIPNKIKQLQNENKELSKEVTALKGKSSKAIIEDLVKNAKEINGINVVAAKFNEIPVDELRLIGDDIKSRFNAAVVALASVFSDKVTFVVMATKGAVEKGIHSGNIVREIAKAAGGSGGGKPDSAQAGGKDVTKADEALNLVYELIK